MGLREIGWGDAEWIHLAQDRDCWQAFVDAVVSLWVLAPWSYLINITYLYRQV
jgi:hypothetical protein